MYLKSMIYFTLEQIYKNTCYLPVLIETSNHIRLKFDVKKVFTQAVLSQESNPLTSSTWKGTGVPFQDRNSINSSITCHTLILQSFEQSTEY